MLLLGIDLGTSSVKISVADANTQRTIASAQFPDSEAPIYVTSPGWAEQNPADWWTYVKEAILKAHLSGRYSPADIGAIGIAYQMHGLVAIDAGGHPVRNSIIWCDSRAVSYGDRAFKAIGEAISLQYMLNSPGNFTASKLAWVKEHEPEVYKRIDKVMLPGDYIAYRLTGEITTTASALSEGVFWNFQEQCLSDHVMDFFGFDPACIPPIHPVFGIHGLLTKSIADKLNLQPGIPVSYKAGDQPNNALSLNVMRPGDVAATAGTSGVIYGIADNLFFDRYNRVNSFAHVNHTGKDPRIGVLLCINACGILNKSIRQLTGNRVDYSTMNKQAALVNAGSDGLLVLPFGNGAERMLGNRMTGAQIRGWDLNLHQPAHFYRAVQEGVAFAFRYGFDIMRENGMIPTVIRAGMANMFLSEVFSQSLADILNVPVELYNADGSVGAALGAGIGAGILTENDLGKGLVCLNNIEPKNHNRYVEIFSEWRNWLNQTIT